MKKEYMNPLTKWADMESETLLSGSGVTATETDIDYGGVDEDGELEPSAKVLSVWD